ncbi:MAG: hypothetical protein ABJC98_17500 [Bacteroidota bacterium]
MMPVKINDATINRPEGNRIIDAPAVSIDLKEFTAQLKEESAWEKNDRNAITVFKTNGMTLVLTALHKNATIDDLEVEGILTLQVIEGAISIVSADNETLQVKEKQMIVLHPGAKQQVTAEEDTVMLLSNIKAAQ